MHHHGQPLPSALQRVIDELAKLPAIGRKSAQRLALHLLKVQPSDVQRLGSAIHALREEVGLCRRCGFLAEEELCSICKQTSRDHGLICVVEEPGDVLAIERAGAHRGAYHVLHGRLAPLQGVLPQHLNLDPLLERVRQARPCPVREVIAATNPTADGDATALFLSGLLAEFSIPVTRLAYGIANNSTVEFADDTTLSRAISGRRPID
jgi:recombination protein RecR